MEGVLTFHVVHDRAADLPRAFDQANFDFDSKTLRGVEKQRDRWKRGIAAVDGYIGEGLGELYVKKHFPPEHKAKVDELIANLRAGLKSQLESSAWIDAATRAEALEKLEKFEARIGYQVKWRDYSALTIERGKHFENVTAARHFEWNRLAARLKEQVDRNEWLMTPQTVNAYIRFADQPDQLPRGHPAAAVLRSQREPGGELRLDRRRHRPRNRPRLRRSGPRVRQHRQGSQLVDAGDEREVHRDHQEAGGTASRPSVRSKARA